MKSKYKTLYWLILWAILVMLVIINMGCEKPTESATVYFSAAYPGFGMCEDLAPEYMTLTIAGDVFNIPVKEVAGGLVSDYFNLPLGMVWVSDVIVYNARGEITHYVVNEQFKHPLKVNFAPFKFDATATSEMIPSQLFCK